MATKLKGLEVGKVDFVDEGANQRADIKLLKGKNKAEETSDPEIGLFKRFLNWISGEVQKSATTFDEQINAVSMDAIRDEIWSVCYALQNSLNSILCDPELDSSGKQSAMDTSIEQFATAMKEYMGLVFHGQNLIKRCYSGKTVTIRNVSTRIRASIFLKARRKIHRFAKKIKNKKIIGSKFAMSTIAYNGWFVTTDSFLVRVAECWDQLISMAKNIISRYAKQKSYAMEKYYKKWRKLNYA